MNELGLLEMVMDDDAAMETIQKEPVAKESSSPGDVTDSKTEGNT